MILFRALLLLHYYHFWSMWLYNAQKPDGPFALRLETSRQSFRMQEILEEVFFICQMRQCWDVQNIFLSTYWRHPVERTSPHWHQTTWKRNLLSHSREVFPSHVSTFKSPSFVDQNFARLWRHSRCAWSPEKPQIKPYLKWHFPLQTTEHWHETSVGQECSL